MATKLKAIASVLAHVLMILIILAAAVSRGDEIYIKIPERVIVKLQSLFQKHYPKANFKNEGNSIHFEFDVTTFEFPYTGPPGKKHESTTRRGPKKGGILCNVSMTKGPYRGTAVLFPSSRGQVSHIILDRDIYKDLLMAPYSPKRDAHLWVAVSYPPDANVEFLTQIREIMADFEKNGD